MIGRLTGHVAAAGTDEVVLDVGGVGYRLTAGGRTLARLVRGEAATVFVATQMSENAIRLYGFSTDQERAWFERLQDAPGVGAKAALAILEVLTPTQLFDAITLGDAASVTRAHGVGKKLAERVVSEFKGKPPPSGLFIAETGASPDGPSSADAVEPPVSSTSNVAEAGIARDEALSALINLGYGQSDALRAVAAAMRDAPEAETAALIRLALKDLAS